MNQTITRSKKLGWGLLSEQLKWAAWFLVIMFIILIGLTFIAGIQLEDFLISNNASAIFMLIVGILYTYGFLDYYVKFGITRKNFFKAALFASVLLSIVLAFFFVLMVLLLEGVFSLIGIPIPWTEGISENGILSALTSFSTFTITHFAYFLIGWLIGLGFYRFLWKIGLLFVAASVVLVSLLELLHGSLFSTAPISLFPEAWMITGFPAYLITALLFLALITVNYRLVKDVTIRLH